MKKIGFLAILMLLMPCLPPLRGETNKALKGALIQLRSCGVQFSLGLDEFAKGRHKEASTAFRECIRKMPRHAYAHYYLANIRYIEKDYQTALTHMEQALGQFAFMRELSDYADKLSGKKIDTFQRMLQTEWENTTSCRTSRELESLSGLLSDDQKNKELLARRRQRLQDLQKAQYLYFSGNVFFQLRRFSEASRRYQEAIELNPRHADATNNLAAISYLAGEYSAAATILEKAEQLGLEDNLSLKLKHLVFEALGRPTEGILQEDMSSETGEDLGVRRWSLAFHSEEGGRPPLYENCYILFSRKSRQAVVIDPGVQDSRISEFVHSRNLEVKAILNTHAHMDHIGADRYFSGLFEAPLYAPKKDAPGFFTLRDRYLEDGNTLDFNGFSVRAIHTPGHTPGSLCFLAGDFLFSGDTLFKNDLGRIGTDDKAESKKVQKDLIQNIKDKLLTLPGRTKVCPGHGKTTTIADETAHNPFLKK